MTRILLLLVAFVASSCTLLDRSKPPEILSVTTDAGDNPSVGRGRRVNVILLTDDPDNDELDFRWIASGGTFTSSSNDTLIDLFQDSVAVVWEAPGEIGVYSLMVEVSDGVTGEIRTDMMQISVTQGSPVALLEPDRVVAFEEDATVTVDGSGSNDPDEDQLSYFWRQLLGPAVALQGANGPTPTFTPPGPGDYIFELSVADDLAPGVGDTSDVDFVLIRVLDRGGSG